MSKHKKSMADRIASPRSEKEHIPSTVSGVPESNMNIPQPIADEATTGNNEVAHGSTLIDGKSLKEKLMAKGIPESIASTITPEMFDVIGKERKNIYTQQWLHSRKGTDIQEEQSSTSAQAVPIIVIDVPPVEQPATPKVKNMTSEIEALRADTAKAIADAKNEIAETVTKSILTAINAKQDGFVASTTAASKQLTTEIPAGKVSFADFYRKAIPQLKTMNKIDPETQKPYTGVHVLYGKNNLNSQLRIYYGDSIDCRAVTQKMVDDGVVKITPAKGGVLVFLAEDYKPKEKKLLINGL